jgi:hypothetical protein
MSVDAIAFLFSFRHGSEARDECPPIFRKHKFLPHTLRAHAKAFSPTAHLQAQSVLVGSALTRACGQQQIAFLARTKSDKSML